MGSWELQGSRKVVQDANPSGRWYLCFERYTEKSAPRNFSLHGTKASPIWESVHRDRASFCWVLLREDKVLANRFLYGRNAAIESIRKQIEAHTTGARESFDVGRFWPFEPRSAKARCWRMAPEEGRTV